ncbi:MAG: PEP-CTERM sorting domain-containing protein [Gemmatimonadota bacterium]
MRLTTRLTVLAASLSFVASTAIDAQSRYVVHDNPWGESATIASGWNQAFGEGNWGTTNYAGADAGSIFSSGTRLVWLEGGDGSANTFNGFLITHRSTIETWVSNGGRLVLNAAPNVGGNIDFGFGGLTLNFGDSYGSNAVAVDAAHQVFNGPAGAIGTSFSGTAFSHAFVTGAGLDAILVDEYGRTVLGELTFGAGRVLAGGMTTTNWHSPSPDAQNLNANLLSYADLGATTTVPEPSSMVLLAAGMLGLGVVARRKTTRA